MGDRPLARYAQWLPASFADLIAGAIVIGGLIILALGIDGEVKSLTALSAGWLFSSSWQKRNQTRRTQ